MAGPEDARGDAVVDFSGRIKESELLEWSRGHETTVYGISQRGWPYAALIATVLYKKNGLYVTSAPLNFNEDRYKKVHVDSKRVIVVDEGMDPKTALRSVEELNRFCFFRKWREDGFRYVTASPFNVMKKEDVFEEALYQGMEITKEGLDRETQDLLANFYEQLEGIEETDSGVLVVSNKSNSILSVGVAVCAIERYDGVVYRDITLDPENAESERAMLQGREVLVVDDGIDGKIINGLLEMRSEYDFNVHVINTSVPE